MESFINGLREGSIYSHPGGIPAPEAGLKVQADVVTQYAEKVLNDLIGIR